LQDYQFTKKPDSIPEFSTSNSSYAFQTSYKRIRFWYVIFFLSSSFTFVSTGRVMRWWISSERVTAFFLLEYFLSTRIIFYYFTECIRSVNTLIMHTLFKTLNRLRYTSFVNVLDHNRLASSLQKKHQIFIEHVFEYANM
jgi:hypothetical protein